MALLFLFCQTQYVYESNTSYTYTKLELIFSSTNLRSFSYFSTKTQVVTHIRIVHFGKTVLIQVTTYHSWKMGKFKVSQKSHYESQAHPSHNTAVSSGCL